MRHPRQLLINRRAVGSSNAGCRSHELDAKSVETLAHPLVGGLILFTRNLITDPKANWCARSSAALGAPSAVAVRSGSCGRVQRFRELFYRLPAGVTIRCAYQEWKSGKPAAQVG